MDLKTYIAAERGRAGTLAKRLGISKSYLSQLANGQSPISPERAVEIWNESDHIVTRQEMFPKNWTSVWPELPPLPE